MAGSINWNDQFYVGKGVDSQTQKTYGDAIDFDQPIAESPGIRSSYYLYSLTSTHDLMQSLNVSAAASVPGIGAFSASAEFELSTSTEMNSFYTYALVRVTVLNPPEVIRNAKLKPEARTLLESGGWSEFATSYGWEYIAGKVTGGSFYGLIECQTTSLKQQQNIRAQLSASYGPFSASAEVTSELRESMSEIGLNVVVYRSGGTAAFPTTFEDMLAEAKNFPTIAQGSPVTVAALVNDYRTSVPVPAVPPQDSLVVMHQKNTLEDLGREYQRLRQYKASVEFVLSRDLSEFDEYREFDSATLSQQRDNFESSLSTTAEELHQITRKAKNCQSDINSCETYVSNIETLPLPTMGGELMNLQQLEQRISKVESDLIPVGTVVPFYGSIADADAKRADGWWICDGRTITDPDSPSTGQPTPDLRGRFPMGTTDNVGVYGGSSIAHVPEHRIQVVADGFAPVQDNIPPIGPKEFGVWGRHHPNISHGTVPATQINTIPPFISLIYLLKAV